MPFCTYKTHSLHYREQGQGPLLVILPGNTASSAWHRGELHYFGQTHRAVVLDILGTGQSERLDPWPEDWWFEAACQACALAEQLGEERFIISGASGGAAAALLAAIHFPERIIAVMADSCVEHFSPQGLHEEVKTRELKLPEQVAFWETAHGDDWEQVVHADSTLLRGLADRGGNVFAERLSEISCPVLLTASRRDSFLPDVAEQLASMGKKIPKSTVHVSDGGDHPFMWTMAEEFQKVAAKFLSAIKE